MVDPKFLKHLLFAQDSVPHEDLAEGWPGPPLKIQQFSDITVRQQTETDANLAESSRLCGLDVQDLTDIFHRQKPAIQSDPTDRVSLVALSIQRIDELLR
ncbi:MAG: hypothetical protein AB8G23_02180 [Myxococcota bacterium]